jgi:hypothetical protein
MSAAIVRAMFDLRSRRRDLAGETGPFYHYSAAWLM